MILNVKKNNLLDVGGFFVGLGGNIGFDLDNEVDNVNFDFDNFDEDIGIIVEGGGSLFRKFCIIEDKFEFEEDEMEVVELIIYG